MARLHVSRSVAKKWSHPPSNLKNIHYCMSLEVKYLGKKYLVFVNSNIGDIFGSHLGNGGHIEKLRDGSIAYFIQ